MSKKQFQARQGDIFFRFVDGPPKTANRKPKSDAVLAYGEVTGHCHKVTNEMSEMESYEAPEGIYVFNKDNEIGVSHDEHGTIKLPKNTWILVTRQREYDPSAAERERRVQD